MEKWLHSYIEWKGEFIKRGQFYKIFLHDGILPFLDSMGYIVGTSPRVLYGYIVSGLYENRDKSTVESEWNTEHFTSEWILEDKIHFYHIMNREVWNVLWADWGKMEDFSEFSFRGIDRRTDIEHFMWKQVDLENSYQSEVLYELMNDDYEQEPEESIPKKIDVYMLETSGWGGLRR